MIRGFCGLRAKKQFPQLAEYAQHMRCSPSVADRLGGLVTQVKQYAKLPASPAAAAEVEKVGLV